MKRENKHACLESEVLDSCGWIRGEVPKFAEGDIDVF